MKNINERRNNIKRFIIGLFSIIIMSFSPINVLAQDDNNLNNNADVNTNDNIDNDDNGTDINDNNNNNAENANEDFLYTNLTYGAGGLVIGGIIGYLIFGERRFKEKDTL